MLKHDNVLPCLGFALVDGIPALVSYWMENGTLTDFLSQNKHAHILLLVRKKTDYVLVTRYLFLTIQIGDTNSGRTRVPT